MLSKTIRHFTILDKIGAGGMGEVYRARDTQLQRTVAIKVLSAVDGEDAERQRRFVQEAQSASALNHPNIITVYEAASENSSYFIVMEYVEGKPLSELIAPRRMNFRNALKIGVQIADALSCAHAAGIIHRDIKPSNIMVREDGLVKVLDFGLAKLVENQAAAELEITRSVALTREGVVLGTLNYMSPEQLQSGKVDTRSDIFSFGIVLFEMLTGQRAFQREFRLSSVSAILRDQPQWPAGSTDGLPRELERIIGRCLRQDPERRYQSIKDVKIALQDVLEDSLKGRFGATLLAGARSRIAVSVSMAVVLVLSSLGAWRLVRRDPEPLRLTLRPLTDDEGTTRFPALSPDGKLLTYASNRTGNTGLDIWVQQLAPGARPIRITSDPGDELSPAFSPDGSQIAFTSNKDGGSLYVMPALGGEQRLVAHGSVMASPRFSPDGKWLAVAPHAVLFPASGGSPRRLVEGSAPLWSPVWSPDGKHVLLAADVRESEPGWCVVPAGGGPCAKLESGRLGPTQHGPREWIGQSILFSDGDIKRVRVRSAPWRIDGAVESLTSSPGVEMEPRAISHPRHPGRLMIVFTYGAQQSSLWELPVDQGIAAPGGARRLFTDHADRHTPSVSANGKRLTYVRAGLRGFEVHARELDTGQDRILATFDTRPRARIAPDGSVVAINPHGALEEETVINLVSWSGTETRPLCNSCGLIYDWSPDGKRILYRSGKPVRFSDIDIRNSSHRVVALDPKYPLGAAVLSPDERWMALHYEITANIRAMYIAPVRDGIAAPREQWISVMDRPGVHVRPWWSGNGQLLYFLSDMGGKTKLWAQRLAPADRKPVGEPFVIYAPADERFTVSAGSAFGPAVSAGRIIFQMIETNTNIWLGE